MSRKLIILRNAAAPGVKAGRVALPNPDCLLSIPHPYESAVLVIPALDKFFRGALYGEFGKKVVMLGASTELTMKSAKVLSLMKKRTPRPRSPFRKSVGKN